MDKATVCMFSALLAGAAAGCHDDDRDVTAPAAPRGLYSVTGDRAASVRWVGNTEGDLAGYHVYVSSCPRGPGCPFQRIGTTRGTDFVATSLVNGATYYFAVAAYDRHGNESALSYEDVFDTPRPAGVNAALRDFTDEPTGPTAWDFSSARTGRYDDPTMDVFFGDNGAIAQMFAVDSYTDIQDAGWHPSLDGVDYAPPDGWSPTGTVELIVGHCYVVWTRDDNYAKFRVTSVSPAQVTFDWAYQTATGNRELSVRPARTGEPQRRAIYWARSGAAPS
jgi:hypothetical protein